jgi:hypothetical protein
MADTTLSKEAFFSISEASGLDVSDPHMDELYAFVLKILRTLRSIDSIELRDTEPLPTFVPHQEE